MCIKQEIKRDEPKQLVRSILPHEFKSLREKKKSIAKKARVHKRGREREKRSCRYKSQLRLLPPLYSLKPPAH